MKDWLLYSFLSLLFWGIWAFLPRFAVTFISPRTLTIYQTIGISVTVLGIFAFSPWKIETHPMGIFIGILSGSFGILGTYCYNIAMQRGQASIVLMLSALYPVVTLILIALFFREMITLKQGTGIMFAFLAITLLSTG